MPKLDERTVVVTGAGRGIGREHALLAAAEGANGVVNDTGAGADGRRTDPSLAEAVAKEITAGEFGAVHGLVNNAGMKGARWTVAELDEELTARV